MFNITQHKGFRLTFSNGYSVSIQWGVGNYCDHYGASNYYAAKDADHSWESRTAEVAVLDPSDKFVSWTPGKRVVDDVQGYLSADKVAELIALVSTHKEDDRLSIKLQDLKFGWDSQDREDDADWDDGDYTPNNRNYDDLGRAL